MHVVFSASFSSLSHASLTLPLLLLICSFNTVYPFSASTVLATMSVARYDISPSPPSTNRPVGGRRISPRRTSRNKNKSTMVNSQLLELPSRKRRSGRGSSSLWELARFIKEGKQIVFITGAGLSVASGVRAFRTTNDSSSKKYSSDSAWKNNPASRSGSTHGKKKLKSESKKGLVEEQPLGIWNSTLWTNAKREAFRKDPMAW